MSFLSFFEVLRLQRHLDGGKAQREGDVDVLVCHEDAATGPFDIKGVWIKGVISSDGQRKEVRKPHFRSKGQHSLLLTGNWFPHGWTEMEQLWSG